MSNHNIFILLLCLAQSFSSFALHYIQKIDRYIIEPEKKIHHLHYERIRVENSQQLSGVLIYIQQDKFTTVESGNVSVIAVNTNKVITQIPLKKFDKVSPFDSNSHSDISYLTTNVKSTIFPIIIQFEYAVLSSNLMFYPSLQLNLETEDVYDTLLFSIELPSATKLRYYLHQAQEPIVTLNQDLTTYAWNFYDLAKHKFQPYTPLKQKQLRIETAPTIFKIDGQVGNAASWESLSSFLYHLNKDRMDISRLENAFLPDLTHCLTRKDSVKTVYEHLQNSTHYYNVSLGIGGWQSKPASDVQKTGYGDCKGLSTYFVNLLQLIGIEAYCAAINLNPTLDVAIPEFPSPRFNHVIVCVPIFEDTLWLECTSQINSFSFIHEGIAGHFALIYSEKNGKLVRLPKYANSSSLLAFKEIHAINSSEKSCLIDWQVEARNGGFNLLDFSLFKFSEVQDQWLKREFGKNSKSTIDESKTASDAHHMALSGITETYQTLFNAGKNSIYSIHKNRADYVDLPSLTNTIDYDFEIPKSIHLKDSIVILTNSLQLDQNQSLNKIENFNSEKIGFINFSYQFESPHRLLLEMELELNAGTYKAEDASYFNVLLHNYQAYRNLALVLKSPNDN